jgi:hypothetical protein
MHRSTFQKTEPGRISETTGCRDGDRSNSYAEVIVDSFICANIAKGERQIVIAGQIAQVVSVCAGNTTYVA